MSVQLFGGKTVEQIGQEYRVWYAAQPEEKMVACQAHGQYVEQVKDGNGGWKIVAPYGCPDCRRRAIRESIMQGSDIPERYYPCTISTWTAKSDEQRAIFAMAEDYISHLAEVLDPRHPTWGGRSVILVGNPGTGKTHLAIAVAKRVLAGGGFAAYQTASGILSRVFSDRSQLKTLAEIDFLIIDEVGRSSEKAGATDVLHQVIDERYQRCRPTWLISNLAIGGLVAHLGAAAIDRFRERGGGAYSFGWESQRK